MSSLSKSDLRAFVVSEAADVFLVSYHLVLGVEEVDASAEVDGHSLDHIEILDSQLILLALLVLVELDLVEQFEDGRHLWRNVVNLGEVAGLVVAQQEAFVEPGNAAVVHVRLVLFLKAQRQSQQIAGLSEGDFVEVADEADATDEHVVAGRHGRGQALAVDHVGVAVLVLQGQVVVHRLLQLHLLQAGFGHPQNHAEGLSHHAVVVHQTDPQRRPVLLVEVAVAEPLDEGVGSGEQMFGLKVVCLRSGEQSAERDDVSIVDFKGVESLDGGAKLSFEFDFVPECEGELGEVEQLSDLIAEFELNPILAEDVD
jgi:hypothetical protein